MRTWDLLQIAFMNLWRRKLRAFLTLLGMAIGTTSIVVMVSLGIGMQESTRQMFESWGNLSTITVNSYSYVDMGNGMGTSKETVLDDKAVQAFRSIPGVKAVMPQIQTYGIVTSGQYMSNINIMGVEADVAEAFGFKLREGRMPEHVGGDKVELVFGNYVLNEFYNPRTGKQAIDPKTGESKLSLEKSRFKLTFDWNAVAGDPGAEQTTAPGKTYKLQPVGIQSEEGNDNAYWCLADLNTLKKLAKENKNFIQIDFEKFNSVLIRCESSDRVAEVQKAIEELGYTAHSLQSALDIEQQSAKQTQSLLGAIGGVALLVAAIGIINTMMMSIYERTKEIGIIKVLGCRMKNIAAMFLAEASFIGFFGGLLGLGLSYLLGYLLNTFMFQSGGGGMGNMSSIIPLWLAVGGVLFSVCVAVISGLYPSLKAMRLSALSAIRSE